MIRRRWTDEEIERLRAAHADGVSTIAAVALKLKRDPTATHQKANALGLLFGERRPAWGHALSNAPMDGERLSPALRAETAAARRERDTAPPLKLVDWA